MTSRLGAVAALTCSVTWAFGSARYALASREVSPIRVNLVRMCVAWPAFIIVGLVTGTLADGITRQGLGWLTLSTFCSYAFADVLFFGSARRIGVSSALAIASTYPLWAALKGTLVDGEAFTLGRAAGTLCCVGGVATIVKLSNRGDTSDGARDGLGVPLALATSVLWAGNTIAIKAGSVGMTPWTVNSIRYALAICVLSTLIVLGRAPGATKPARGWLPMVPAIVVDCLIGSTIFIYALGHTDLAVGATLSSLAPLISLPFALWMGAEKPSVGKLVAIATTVGGIVLLAW